MGDLGRFSSARLTPVAVEPVPCDLPYGLTWDRLRPALPELAASSAGAQAFVAHEKQGLNGGVTSCILTLRYPTDDGPRDVTVFVKQARDLQRAEAAKYRFVSSHGVPVPRVLLTVEDAAGEVIVLEFLASIGIEAGCADELLRLIAALNAVADPPTRLFDSPAGMPVAEFDDLVKRALGQLDATSWFGAYKAAEEQAAAGPMAINHGEMYFQQVGRTSGGELVMFDLETMATRPRYADVASVLAGLSRRTGRGERELFGVYLAEFARLADEGIDEADAWQDMLNVRVVSMIQSLPWQLEMIDDPDVGFVPSDFVRTVAGDLDALGWRA